MHDASEGGEGVSERVAEKSHLFAAESWQQASERISSVVVYLPEMIYAIVNSAGEYPRRRAPSTTCTNEWQLSNCRQLTNKQIAEVQSVEMLSSHHKAKSHEREICQEQTRVKRNFELRTLKTEYQDNWSWFVFGWWMFCVGWYRSGRKL
jgi:hypothetical protein